MLRVAGLAIIICQSIVPGVAFNCHSLSAKSFIGRGSVTLLRSKVNSEGQDGIEQFDVSDLGLTMEDLNAPLPKELLQGITSSGYESTTLVEDSGDRGCEWEENADTVDVTLKIPTLRGQPAACLACEVTETTATITAFGYAVWSCVLRGQAVAGSFDFKAEEGDDMTPAMALSVKKADPNERWGGFIAQVGENSIVY
mmetsp:Transcript_14336/g.17285  ORF Transcript_14336/g.17285 Transcript_14336/m.17285 type:complete len:198 (+) Transcript_14336:39-632(+)